MTTKRSIVVVGSLNVDLVVSIERLPRPGETVQGGDLQMFPGGKGANQACAAARLGGRVAMVGRVGEDANGRMVLDSLRSSGVSTERVQCCDTGTGTAFIQVMPTGENAIVISAGANETLTAQDVVQGLTGADMGLVLCQLEVPLEATETAVHFARQRGAVTILDPAPVRELSKELLIAVDYLTPNQQEAAALLGRAETPVSDYRDAREAAAALLALGPRTVVIKMGHLGCLAASTSLMQEVSGYAVNAVDTTAAGDTFNAALAVALSENRPLLEAANFANQAGALSVTKAGAQSSIPLRAELEERFGAVSPRAR